VNDKVGDIALNEEFAGFCANDSIRRHAAIGTANPKVVGLLVAFQTLKIIGTNLQTFLNPRFIGEEKFSVAVHFRWVRLMVCVFDGLEFVHCSTPYFFQLLMKVM